MVAIQWLAHRSYYCYTESELLGVWNFNPESWGNCRVGRSMSFRGTDLRLTTHGGVKPSVVRLRCASILISRMGDIESRF